MPSENDPGLTMAQLFMSDELKKQFAVGPTSYDPATANQASPALREWSSFPRKEIENWFIQHAVTPEQLRGFSSIRYAAKILAETINRNVPAGPDKTAAMRKLREAVWTANAGIACHVEVKRPTIHPDGSITTDPQE